jgi:hypothetical protein
LIAVAQACAAVTTTKRVYTGRERCKALAETRAALASDPSMTRRWIRDMGKLARRQR